MICPNLNDPAIKQEFEELVSAVGEVAAYDVWNQNNGNSIDRSPNGEPSELFTALLSHFAGDRVQAIQARAKTFSKSFKTRFKGMLSNTGGNTKVMTDDNGEILFDLYRVDILEDNVRRNTKVAGILKDVSNITDSRGLMDYVITTDSDEVRVKIANFFVKLNDLGYVSSLPVAWAMDLNADGVHRYGIDEEESSSTYKQTRSIDILFNPISLSALRSDKVFEVFTHEVAHHLTAELLLNNTKVRSLVERARKRYQAVYNDESLYNTSEFLAKFLTNSEIRQNLAKLDVAPDSNTKWYTRVYNAIKQFFTNLFNEVEVPAEELTVDTILDYITNYVQEYPLIYQYEQELLSDDLLLIDYFANDNTRVSEIADKAKLINSQIREGIQNRITALRNRAADPYYVKEVKVLHEIMDGLEDQDALFSFIKYLRSDLENPFEFLKRAYDGIAKISPKQLVQFKQDYLGFYDPILSKVSDLMHTGFFDNLTLTEKQTIEKLVIESRNILARIKGMYNRLVQEEYQRSLRRIGEVAGSPTMETYVSNNTIETDIDINWFELYLGSINNANDEALRAVYHVVSNVKNDVERATFDHGKQLSNLPYRLGEQLALFEVDDAGKKTGYLVRDKNYGKFKRDYEEFLTKLRDEYGLERYDQIPLNNEDFISYNQKKNEWLTKHAERRYVPEYYELFAGLSMDTALAREEMQTNINRILNQGTDSEGNRDIMQLSQANWEKLQNAYIQKRRLSSLRTVEGTRKQGYELAVALELSKLKDILKVNIIYKKDVEAWEKARQAALKKYNPAMMYVWDERNSVEEYDPSFYKLLDSVNKRDYGAEYNSLQEMRSEILKLFRNIRDSQINADLIPDNTKILLRKIDIEMKYIRLAANKETQTRNGFKFSDVAEIVFSDAYKRAKREAELRDETEPGYYLKWFNENHYADKKGFTAYSYWTYIRPTDANMIRLVPSNAWSEISEDSAFYNEKFDNNDTQYLQPKKFDENDNVLYDNSAAFNVVMSNPELKALHEAILSSMIESNTKLVFQQNLDPYKLPQISGTMYQHLKNTDNVLKGFGRYIKDKVVVKNDDTDFNTSTVKRPDGSKLYFVPTHYTKMLDKPETLTNDIVGATIAYFRMAENFKQMNKIAPTLEIIKEQLGARTYNKSGNLLSRRSETVSGTDTNAYKKMEQFMKMHIYGERKEEVNVNWKQHTLSVTKLMSMIRNYTQTVNLAFNITAIEVGALTGMHQALLESLVGRYYTFDDFRRSTPTVLKNLFHIMMNWGNYRSNNKILGLLEYNQVSRTNDEIFDKMNYTRAGRFVTNHLWYGGYSGGDFVVKSSILTAIYFNHKLVTDPETGQKEFLSKREFMDKYYRDNKSRGELMWKTFKESLYDAYETIDGRVKIKDDYRDLVPLALENRITNLAKNLSAKADGVLNDLDRAYVHANAFTQMVFMHRNFMIINIQDRVTKAKGFNYQTGVMDEALYRTATRVIWEYLKMSVEAIKALDFEALKKLPVKDESDRANINKLITEFAMMACYWIMTQLMDKEADDEDSTWLTQHIAYMAKRHYFEVHAQYDPTDLVNIIKSPSAAMGTLNQIGFLLDILEPTALLAWDENQGRVINRGPYKGKTRYEQALWKASPFKHLIEATDPNLKRRYLDNMILR